MKKKTKMKKIIRIILPICIAILFGLALFGTFKFITREKEKTFLEKLEPDIYANITNYVIYGIHMNIEGNFTLPENVGNPKLVLSNGKTEIEIPWELEQEENSYTFDTSKYINEGLNLEKLPEEDLYLVIKAESENEKNETIYKYYSVENKSSYDKMEYYTLTKNNKNDKIEMEWNTYEECPTWRFRIKETKLPENVYDITIDPGHDGTDPGKVVCMTSNSIYDPQDEYGNYYGCNKGGEEIEERQLNLNVSMALKEKLESLGYKVTMTRTDNEKRVEIYEPMGSATMANDTKSKFNLAIHHNSSGISGGDATLKGIELYVANDTNFDFAKILINELEESAGITTSPKTKYIVDDGIYQRFFTQEEIDQDDYKQYKNTNMIWYYYIREVGGVSTHAIYNGYDQENYPHPNDHYHSNNTAEPYLFELGYMDNLAELKNILNNKEGYANGIVNGLQKYLEQE